MYKFFEVILIHPFHKAIRRNPDTQWISNLSTSTGRCEGCKGCGRGKGHRSTTLLVVLMCSLKKAQYSPAPPLLLIEVMFVKFSPKKQFRTVKEKILLSSPNLHLSISPSSQNNMSFSTHSSFSTNYQMLPPCSCPATGSTRQQFGQHLCRHRVLQLPDLCVPLHSIWVS